MQQDGSIDTPPLSVLSFSALEKQVSDHLHTSSNQATDRQELASAITMFISYVAAAISGTLFTSSFAKASALFLFIIAIIAGCRLGYITARREIPEIKNRRKAFATELDKQSEGYKTIATWLKSFPSKSLEEELQFAQKKLEIIEQRSGFLVGSADRFGFLAVLTALYLQFKDMTVPSLSNMSVSSVLLASAILAVYFAGLWATSYKWQLTLYIQLLQMAIKPAQTG